MNFTTIEYKRPVFEAIKLELESLIESLKQTNDVQLQIEGIDKINSLRDEFSSWQSFVHVKHSIDTSNELFEKENSYFDQVGPQFTAIVNSFYQTLNSISTKKELMKEFGEHLFNGIEVSLKTFKQSIIEDLQLENQLKSEYSKLIANTKIPFKGKEYNLSGISPHIQNEDRSHRKEATEAMYSSLEREQDKLDSIYDQLVKIRHKIAVELGYENYIELGYARLGRTDYSQAEVKVFRESIVNSIVPFVKKLKESQRKRIGVEKLEYYDLGVKYFDGNPTPKGEPKWIIEQGKKMYKELSPETDNFFSFMLENGVMDLETKDNKMAGGYCTYLPSFKLPFIFSNFNGTSHDIDVLTHEAGHAFQIYNSREMKVPEYYWPTLEACEIHSMSMEFFTWPWMETFFKEDTSKYKFNHITGGLSFLPYGAAVDEFQHIVYENPQYSPEQRNSKWLELEKKYNLSAGTNRNSYLDSGRFWQKQGHIYSSPFYYIDYTLAQTCAYQFWSASQKDFKSAWDQYVLLCKKGGSDSFTNLVDFARLKSPFKEGALDAIVAEVDEYTRENCAEFRV